MENDSIIICGDTSFFEDDIKTKCSSCNTNIVHRPHMPKDIKKLCIRCGFEEMSKQEQVTIAVTKETQEELKAVNRNYLN
jgi:predicted nucleic-acid-binding Zn-ribbon protein